MNGPLDLSLWDLAAGAALIAVNGALSAWLGLGMGRRLLIASLRTVVQLLILGVVLDAIFGLQHAWPVLAFGAAMIGLASREALQRSSRRWVGAGPAALVSLLVAAGGTATLASAGIVGVEPWWEPRYLLPMLGMILGNSLTGISLGLDRCLAELDEGAARVELALAFGATRWEAARPVAAEALRTGMIPILNSMAVVGLVTIPGMMTGQILGGVAPALAARYQILILFLIASATALGTAGSVLLCLRALFDDQHRLRRERIVKR